MTLYDIADNYRSFFDAVEAGEIPEDAIAGTLEAINGEFDNKVDNIACMIKNWLTLANGQREEAKKLMDLAKDNEKRAEHWKDWLTMCMTMAGKKKVETTRCCVTVTKGRKSTQVDSEKFVEWATQNNRDDLLTYNDPAPNKNAIKDAISSGISIPFAQIVTGKDGVTIK